jgi:peptidoglycan DL-endopeptidase CwlO
VDVHGTTARLARGERTGLAAALSAGPGSLASTGLLASRPAFLTSTRLLASTVLLAGTLLLAAPAPLAAATAGQAQTRQAPARAGIAATASAALRLQAWRYALRQAGKPYRWGGTGPRSFDCSGLVYEAYLSAGVALPRTTQEMLKSPLLVRIPKAEARTGDLAFYGTDHVEMYAWGDVTYGAAHTGTRIGFHQMYPSWHPTMYFLVRA